MKARILMIIASLLLLLLLFSLSGVSSWMLLNIQKVSKKCISGLTTLMERSSFSAQEDELSIHTIENINLLNHYIGMKHIHAENFWEFKAFPWVIGSLLVLGLLIAFAGKESFTLHGLLLWE